MDEKVNEEKTANDMVSENSKNESGDLKPEKTSKPMNILKTAKYKLPFRKLLLFIVVGLALIGASAGVTYWLRDNIAKEAEKKQASEIATLKSQKTSLEQQLASEKSKNSGGTIAPTSCTAVFPTESVLDNIKASITSGNTAALEGYMATSVNTILAASEGIGAVSPTQAVAGITDFISSDTTTWAYNFSLPTATLNSYAAGDYAQYFPSIALVGKNSDGKVISFSFDCNGKISTVFMSSSENLLM